VVGFPEIYPVPPPTIIPPPPQAVCDSPDKATRHHTVGTKLGASYVTRQLAGLGVKVGSC
jgi:hypothetical protein